MPLDHHRRICAAKFILKSRATENFCSNQVNLNSKTNFTKRGSSIKSIQTIYTYCSNIIDLLPTKGKEIEKMNHIIPIPNWALKTANYDLENHSLSKTELPALQKQNVF